METPKGERRQARRIAHHFVLHVRQADPLDPTEDWDISTIRNISKTGILFYSSRNYKLGSKLEIRLPIAAQKKCTVWGIVVRSLPSNTIKNTYEVAVNLSDIEEESRKVFYATIGFLIRKEKEKK